MDINLKRDAARKLEQLTESPDIDLHLRVEDHHIEGIAWCQGRRYRLLGVRDDEPAERPMTAQPTRSGQYASKEVRSGVNGRPRWAIWRQTLIAIRGTNGAATEIEIAWDRLKRWSRTGWPSLARRSTHR